MDFDETCQKEVDRISFGEGALRDLKSFFPNPEAMLSYYAHRMSGHFPPDKITGECEGCHRRTAELRAVFEWQGVYHSEGTAIVSLLGVAVTAICHHVFHFLMPAKQVYFSTTHGFCQDCFQQMKQRRIIAALVKQLCLGLVVLAAMIFAAVILFAVLFLYPQPTTSSLAYAAMACGVGIICLAGGLLGGDRIVRWPLPESMRFISKPPFQLIGIKKRSGAVAPSW